MITLLLTRNSPDGNAVRGTLTFPGGSTIPTLENLSYLIPDGTYTLLVTYSPRFKRPLPLVCGVPGRSAIRFHKGSRPEHSLGCILLPTQGGVDGLTQYIGINEKVLLHVSSAAPRPVAK